MASPLLAGIPISSRFAEKLGMAREKQDQQQMTHTKSSTQEDKSWDQTLYEKSDIYRSIKDAYTAPMRAWEGEIDPYSDQGVMEAINLAGVGLTGSIPGGAKGPGSLGIVGRPKVINSIYPKMPGATLKDTKWVQRNVHDEAEIQDILSSGYMLPKAGGKNQKYFTAVEEVDPQTTAKNVLRIKRDKVDPELAVKLEDVEIFNRELNTWEPLSKRKEINKKPKEGLNEISSPIQDLEASVQEQVKQLDNTGWNRLPGAAGKRDSDVQPTFLQKMYKEHPDLVKSKPSELEKLEIKLRRIYKLPEEEIEDIMLPLWSTYLRNQKPDDPAEEHTQKTKMKRWTENEESPLLTAVEKLAGMIEGMNKPRTVIRDKDGRIMGVA